MDLSYNSLFSEKSCSSKNFRAAPKLQTHQDTSCIVASKTLSLFAWVALIVRLKLHETCNCEFVILCWSGMLIIAFLCVQVETSIFYCLVSLFLLQLSICYLYLNLDMYYEIIGTWGAWCCQFARTRGVYKSEKYSYYWTWKIWDWDMVLLPIPTRIQWLFEAVLLWVLPQFHEAQRTASEAYGELWLKVLSLYISLFCICSFFIWGKNKY